MTYFLTAAIPSGEGVKETVEHFTRQFSWERLVAAAILLLVCLLCMKVFLKMVRAMLQRSKSERTVHTIVLSFAKILLVFVTIMLVAGTLGIDTSSLLAILSVAGLAASLALQDSLSNMASGVSLLLTKPFRDGDYVNVGGFSGTVKEVGITYTKLVTPDNQVTLVPNRTITAAAITNYSTEGNRRLVLDFQASYDAPTETVKAALAEAADIPQALADPEPFIRISQYGDSAITYTVRVWTKGEDYWDAHFAIIERVRDSFQRHGVEMTYPHLNVHAVAPASPPPSAGPGCS